MSPAPWRWAEVAEESLLQFEAFLYIAPRLGLKAQAHCSNRLKPIGLFQLMLGSLMELDANL